jgi:hypothetical protein
MNRQLAYTCALNTAGLALVWLPILLPLLLSLRLLMAAGLFRLDFLIAAQGTAILTGLASGEREAAGRPLLLCSIFLASYAISVILTGLLGFRVYRAQRTNDRCGQRS